MSAIEIVTYSLHHWITRQRRQKEEYLSVYHYGEGRQASLSCDLITDAAHYEDYPDFQQPALVLHGAQAPVVPSALSKSFTASHANAKLLLLNSGHELTDVLEPMWHAVRDFLATPVNA